MASASTANFGIIDVVTSDFAIINPSNCGNSFLCTRNRFQPDVKLLERHDLAVYLRQGDRVRFIEDVDCGTQTSAFDTSENRVAHVWLVVDLLQQNKDRFFGIIDKLNDSSGEAWLPGFGRVLITLKSFSDNNITSNCLFEVVLVGSRIMCSVRGGDTGVFEAYDVETMDDDNNEKLLGADNEDLAFAVFNDPEHRLPSSATKSVDDGDGTGKDESLKQEEEKEVVDRTENGIGIVCTIQKNFGFIWSPKTGRAFFHRENFERMIVAGSDLSQVRIDEMFYPMQVVRFIAKEQEYGYTVFQNRSWLVTYMESTPEPFPYWHMLAVQRGFVYRIRHEGLALMRIARSGIVEFHRNALPTYELNISDAVKVGDELVVLVAQETRKNARTGRVHTVRYAIFQLPPEISSMEVLLEKMKVELDENRKEFLLTSKAYTIYVAQLPQDFNGQDLLQYFSHFGTVTHRHLVRCWKTKESRGIAFVSFGDEKSLHNVLANAPHAVRNGHRIIVCMHTRR